LAEGVETARCERLNCEGDGDPRPRLGCRAGGLI
jgi:hypothetical protein